MRSKVIVVDDFYKNPLKVRERAMSSDYANIAPTDYPGFASRVRLESESLQSLIGDLVGTELNVDKSRFTWGGFRFITKDSGSKPIVHADVAADWAGMVYLTENVPNSAGTGFYRHKATGFDAPPTDRQARALGYSDASEFDDRVIRNDKADLSKWDEIFTVAPLFNRMILFRGGEMYHAPLGGWGEGRDDARLTHIFFFNEMPEVKLKAHQFQ